jgi:class 3 adenylate cyclase/tetratricopeptide (TPR) repeat protein
MYCHACKNECADASSFCHHCGAALDSAAAHPAASRGERKQVTVLFSDLSGYTAMNEKLDPEDVKEIMASIFDRISEIISQYEGSIEKFVGDSVMAVFGFPTAHEDDPLRAVRAARKIHACIAEFSREVEARIGRPLSMHSGINTGLVVTGEAEQKKGTHGLIGDTINLAARLQSLAQTDEIMVGEATYRLAKHMFAFEAGEQKTVKGKAEPVQPYKLLAEVHEPEEQRLQGVQAELIGREAQMALLTDAVDKLKSGQGTIVSVVGNAGTGKSRLIREFKATLNLKEIQWREGHAYPYTQNRPYYPLINLMTHAFAIQDGDGPDTIREKVAEGMKALLWNRPEIIPYVGSLFALPYAEIDDLSPEFRREKLKEAIADIHEALARRAPTVLWIEDLHWADNAFLQLLHQLMVKTTLPVLFILVYRPVFTLFPDGPPDNLAWPYHKIDLQDLSAEHTRQMLLSLLKAESVPKELDAFVQEKVEGNPFYLEEVINTLIETRLLTRDNSQWQLTGPITQAAVPATIQGVLSGRLDRLEAESKRILQQASVIGRAFFFEVLNRISEMGNGLKDRLYGLEKLDLIRARSLTPDLEYIFKHALTQEVVYNGLLKKERQQLHERIAVVMETLFADRLPEFCEALAHHYQRGISADKAVDYLIKSGYKAQNQFCLEEAGYYYQNAYELLTGKGELTLEEKTTLIDLLIAWAWVAYLTVDFRQVLPLLAEHLDTAKTIGDSSRYGLIMAWNGWAIWMSSGDVPKILSHLHGALKIAEELGDKRLMAYCCTWLSWVYGFEDFKDKHPFYAQKAIELAEKVGGDHYLNHKALSGIAWASAYNGQWKKGLAASEKAIALGQEHSHLRGMCIGYCFKGASLQAAGRFAEALESAKAALEHATDPLYEYLAKIFLGAAYFHLGQMEKAFAIYEELEKIFDICGWKWGHQWCNAILGFRSLGCGRFREGLDKIDQAYQYLEKYEVKTYVCCILFFKGMVFSQFAAPRQNPDPSMMMKNAWFLIKNLPRAAKKAEDCFLNAINIGTESGAFQIVGQSHIELGRMLLVKKKREKAEKHLMEAKRIFSELENDFYLQQVDQYLGQLKR